MWKRKKEPAKQPMESDEQSSRDDFFAGAGKKIVRVQVELTEPPIITYELWTSKKAVSGYYFVNMVGTVRSTQQTLLERKRCEISINPSRGAFGSESYEKGYIGGAGLRMGYLDVKVNTKAEFARDIVGLFNLHGLKLSQDFLITMDFTYPRSLALDEVDSFEVVRMFFGFRDGKP